MKSHIHQLLVLAVLPCLLMACVDNIPTEETLPSDAVSFDYRCMDARYPLDYYVGSAILFSNTSPTAGELTWDFGDGTEPVVCVAGTDTITHAFATAGTYNVKLSIAGFSKSQVIMISDIKPIVAINPMEGGMCEINSTKISFSLDVPNPQNLPLEYMWIFPDGTMNAEGDTLRTSTDTLPGQVVFSNVGSQTVRLQVKLGGRSLEEALLNVQVGYSKPVPTLYYAERGGHIMAYKLIADAPEGMKNLPFDLGISSGQHPLSLLFKDSLLYVLDCGKQFYYVNDENKVLGDGRISVISKDGKTVETMITNAGQAAFDDPFYGYIEDDYLYYANRNTGIIRVSLTDRNKVYNSTDYPYYVQHSTLGYYKNGWDYGCIGGMFGKEDNVWHWCKHYNGTGIFRFRESDILASPISEATPSKTPKDGIVLNGQLLPKAYAYDKERDNFYFTLIGTGVSGYYACKQADLEVIGSSSTKVKQYQKTYNGLGFETLSKENSALAAIEGVYPSELIGICQLTLDKETGCVYFAYRNSMADSKMAPTGVYYYDPSTDKVELLIEGPSVYGLVINPNASKLF